MASTKCEQCGYVNPPNSLTCNLCQGLLSEKRKTVRYARAKPKSKASERSTGTFKVPMAVPTDRPKRASVAEREAAKGLSRLEQVRERLSAKLEMLGRVEEEGRPVYQAIIQAEQEEAQIDDVYREAIQESEDSQAELEAAETRSQFDELRDM